MELLDSVLLERLDLFDGNRSRNHAPRVWVVIEAVETIHEPFRNGSAAALRHPEHLRKARDRQNAGHDRCRDARGDTAIPEAQEHIGIEEKLRDRAIRARIDLRFQILKLEGFARGFRMLLGIRCDRDFEVGNRLESLHEIDGVCEAARMRHVLAFAALRRIAAERDDVPNPVRPIIAGDVEDLLLGRTHAREVGRGRERGRFLNPRDDVVRSCSRRAVRAVSHRNEARLQRQQAIDGLPERLLHRRVLRREELE